MASPSVDEQKMKITHSLWRNSCFDRILGEGLPLRMMQISNGNFIMDSLKDELEDYDDEQLWHKVSVTTFFMGKYPITQV